MIPKCILQLILSTLYLLVGIFDFHFYIIDQLFLFDDLFFHHFSLFLELLNLFICIIYPLVLSSYLLL